MNKKVLIGSLIILGVVSGSLIYANRNTTNNPLTEKFKVTDAKKVDGSLEAPYNLSSETFDKLIREDSYIISKYSLSSSLSEGITNLDNRQNYSYSSTYSINGIYKGDGSKNFFNASIKTYDEFSNPSSLSLSYGYLEDSELSDIENSIRNIVGSMFNESIANNILESEEDIENTIVPTKSNKYNLKISKLNSSNGEGKILDVIVDFNASDNGNYDISEYKSDDSIEKVYNSIDSIKDENPIENAKKYSSLIGEYSDTRISKLINISYKQDNYSESTSSLSIRTVFEDGSAVTGEISVIKTYSNDKVDEIMTEYKASLPFTETKEQSARIAEGMVKGLYNAEIKISDTDIEKGKFEGTIKNNQFGKDIDLKVTVNLIEDTDGIYSNIEVKSISKE